MESRQRLLICSLYLCPVHVLKAIRNRGFGQRLVFLYFLYICFTWHNAWYRQCNYVRFCLFLPLLVDAEAEVSIDETDTERRVCTRF